ncbi:hypothetical protein [Acidisphaera sp. L21]|uniref:hypothetical protein n=1 Tax=Acidisphaera sp. L21 TaxID=1641851 RepID=UPI00131C3D54|nr:hypothetical protein [Acidisphaera sp. L21]
MLVLIGAGGSYGVLRLIFRKGHLVEPPEEGKLPVWWLRGLLILTCTSVSFSHGTNDGQTSIGLIMLTVIGLMPATHALNPDAASQMERLGRNAVEAIPLIRQYGDDLKDDAIEAAEALGKAKPNDAPSGDNAALPPARSQFRGEVYPVLSEMKHEEESSGANAEVCRAR